MNYHTETNVGPASPDSLSIWGPILRELAFLLSRGDGPVFEQALILHCLFNSQGERAATEERREILFLGGIGRMKRGFCTHLLYHGEAYV